MKTKTYPRLRVARRPSPFYHPWIVMVVGRESAEWAWGRYPTFGMAQRAAADLLHNHWEH